jgi:hypothetical protein
VANEYKGVYARSAADLTKHLADRKPELRILCGSTCLPVEMRMDNIAGIQRWFQTHCNGEWEHSHGVSIETCDNPGWHVRIGIKGTTLENKQFEMVSENVPQEWIDQALGLVKVPFACAEPSSEHWLICYVKASEFNGAGDPSRLSQLLGIFLDWAGNNIPKQ